MPPALLLALRPLVFSFHLYLFIYNSPSCCYVSGGQCEIVRRGPSSSTICYLFPLSFPFLLVEPLFLLSLFLFFSSFLSVSSLFLSSLMKLIFIYSQVAARRLSTSSFSSSRHVISRASPKGPRSSHLILLISEIINRIMQFNFYHDGLAVPVVLWRCGRSLLGSVFVGALISLDACGTHSLAAGCCSLPCSAPRSTGELGTLSV